MSALAITISMLDSAEAKNGQLASSRASSSMSTPQFQTADSNPNQPGSLTLACDQENTQGMARRSSMRSEAVREGGRLPMLRFEISRIGVASRKNSGKPGVS